MTETIDAELTRLREQLAASESSAAAMRECLKGYVAVLTHKNISPPMDPGAQERHAEQAKVALSTTAGCELLQKLAESEAAAAAMREFIDDYLDDDAMEALFPTAGRKLLDEVRELRACLAQCRPVVSQYDNLRQSIDALLGKGSDV